MFSGLKKVAAILFILLVLFFIDLQLKFNFLFRKRTDFWLQQAVLRYARWITVTLKWSKKLEFTIMPPRVPFPKEEFMILSNHLSIVDILLLFVTCQTQQIRFIAKQELQYGFPGASTMLRLQRHIFVRRNTNVETMKKNIQVIKSFLENMSRDISIIIFPEGHRSEDGNVHKFKLGSIKLIQEIKNMPIVYMGIAVNDATLSRSIHSNIFIHKTAFYRTQILGIRYPKNKVWEKQELKNTVNDIEEEIRTWVIQNQQELKELEKRSGTHS